MQNVIRKLMPENDMDFEEICSFETLNCIGIWNHNRGRFVVFEQSDLEMWMYEVPEVKNLEELDCEVCKLIDEHIIRVSECSNYTFKIDEDK